MSQVFLASGNNSESLGHIRYRNILSNSHVKSLEDNSETFDFTTHADKAYSHFIEGNNRVIIPGEDGDFLEFIIYEVQEDRIERQLEVYSYASYIELATTKVIDPHTTDALSAKAHGDIALSGTDWEMGTVEFNGTRTITFDNYTNPFAYLKKIASVFDLELRFRIEHDNGDIVGRYVDLVEKVGQWRGRRVEFGKDLMGLRRIENTENIVTALKVIGPVREDGTRLEVIVEDEEALQRWGRNGQHIITDYEPQFSTEENATRERLIELGEQELAKRVNAIVSYEGTIADLEKVPGLENKKIRFGDTIQIKDTSYEPALYLEARIFFQDRDITDQAQKQVRLGDFIEYTEEEVNAIWKSLQQQIANKIGMSELEEVTYTKGEIDDKDTNVKNEASQDATQKANTAEQNAEDYADQLKQQTDQEINEVNQSVTDLNNYIDGSFHDGIVEESEAKAIENYLNTLNAEKDDIDAKYLSLYSNSNLSGTTKTNLQNAKVDFNAKHSALINAINTAISDGKVTQAEKNSVDSAFSNYMTSLSTLSTRFEQAIDFIGQQKADKAQQNAENHADQVASDAENNAKQYAQQVSDQAYQDAVNDAEQYADDNAVMKGQTYNGISITNTDGFLSVRNDQLVRTVQNATQGIVIQRRASTSQAWQDVFFADSQGNVKFSGELDGAVINGSTFNSRIDSNNYTTIQNNHIHSEGVYYSDWANGNQKGVFDVNDGLITMQSGNTALSTYGKMQVSQFGLAIEHYNNNSRSGGTYIGPDAIGFGDWYDGPNSKGRIYLSGNDIYLDSNGQVVASAFKLDEIRSIYSDNLILRGYNSGTTELNANGAYLIIGNQNTSYVSIRKDLHLEYGSRRIYATSMRTEQDTDTLIQPYGSNGVLVINSSNQYRPVDASAFNNRSLESDKQNIEKWTDSVLQIYRNSDLYKFKLKADVKYGIDHHKYGFVIGDNYNTPDEILNVNKTGVDQYSHSSLNTKAIQELIGVTDDHADEINFLKMEIQYLRGKITQLEGGEV